MTKTVRILLPAALILCATWSSAGAGLKSFRGRLIQDRAANISVEHDGIRVSSYQFLRSLRHVEKLFKDGSPTIRLAVANEAGEPREFAIAVALFDDSGNLVGVAAEDRKLKEGVSEEIELTFKHLNRYARHATTLQLSVESRL